MTTECERDHGDAALVGMARVDPGNLKDAGFVDPHRVASVPPCVNLIPPAVSGNSSAVKIAR
jgi:hypothetical protein